MKIRIFQILTLMLLAALTPLGNLPARAEFVAIADALLA